MTNQEEKLVSNVKKYPNNIAAAIRLTAGQTKATVNQLTHAYYKKNGLRDGTPMFILQSPSGVSINGKVSKVEISTPRTLTLIDEVMPLKGLTQDEKISFFDMIFS